MSIREDIAALRRGDLDLEGLKIRLQGTVASAHSSAVNVLDELHDHCEQGELTQDQYDQLTQFVSETLIPESASNNMSVTGEDGPVTGEDGPVTGEDALSAEDQIAATRLATQVSLTGGENDTSTVDVGMRLRDRFILDEIIGVGGMGTVFRGRDMLKIEAQDRNPFVAVKVLNDSFKQRPDAFIALQREASRQQRLAHPNIATVYDFDRSGGIMFITMEYLDGRTLDQFIKEDVRKTDGLPFEQVLPILEDICAALSHAHARNIVHADFKPGNCFITANDRVKVLDFGIARAMKDPDAEAGDQTLFDPRSIGALTPAYASPEMLADSEEADPRDDIYALACVTYELLSGKHPFHRIPADQAKANGLKPARIKRLNRRQNDALAHGLAFERSERTADVSSFLNELRGGQSGLQWSWPIAATAAGLLLVIAGAIGVPKFMAQQRLQEFSSHLQSGDAERVFMGIDNLDKIPPDALSRVLRESRPNLLDFFRSEFHQKMNVADEAVDYAESESLLETANRLYPDSKAIDELNIAYQQRKDTYLSNLSSQFESYLQIQYLLPDPSKDDLQDLLERLQKVDPTNPLMADTRIAGAYSMAAEQALEQKAYTESGQFIQSGLHLMPTDPGLTDLRDRLKSIEQQIQISQQITKLVATVEATANSLTTTEQLKNLRAPVMQLRELDPENKTIAVVGNRLKDRFQPDIESSMRALQLSQIQNFIEHQADIWNLLDQPGLVRAAQARLRELREQQDNLVGVAREATNDPSLRTSDGRDLKNLLTQLAQIDANDPRIATLHEEVIAAILRRTERHRGANLWEQARQELALANGFAITSSQRDTIRDEETRTTDLQAAERKRQIVAQRQEQQDRENALKEEELRTLQAKQFALENSIIDARVSLENALAQFSVSTPIKSMEAVRHRLQALQKLDPDHASLGISTSELHRLVAKSISLQDKPNEGLVMLAEVRAALGDSDILKSQEQKLVARQKQLAIEAHQLEVAKAQNSLLQTIAIPDQLIETSNRREAKKALNKLINLAGSDSLEAKNAKNQFTRAHVGAANRLIDAKRFSAAEQVLQAGAGVDAQDRDISLAQVRLASEQAAYRKSRAVEQQFAKLEALIQRMKAEIRARQLTRATATLEEYRALDTTGDFGNEIGPRLLSDAYYAKVQRDMETKQFSNARKAILAGKNIQPDDDPRWAKAQAAIQTAQLGLRVLAWFEGNSNRSLTTIRQYIEVLTRTPGVDISVDKAEWTKVAMKRLSRLGDDREMHNRFLADAQSLLPGQSPLLRVKLIPAPEQPAVRNAYIPPARNTISIQSEQPEKNEFDIQSRTSQLPQTVVATKKIVAPVSPYLTLSDIAGGWCGDQLELHFSSNTMEFRMNRQRLKYNVSNYEFQPDRIRVFWHDRNIGNMVFEFGEFINSGQGMTQLRGRPESSSSWQTYNRQLKRCG